MCRYLPTWQELLQHVYTLHVHTLIPGVILVEGLDNYCQKPSEGSDKHGSDQATTELHTSLISASLIDAASVCSQSPDQPVYMIATWEGSGEPSLLHPLDLFFKTIWCVSPLTEDRMQIRNLKACSQTSELRFEFSKTEDFVIFHRILKIEKGNKKIHE